MEVLCFVSRRPAHETSTESISSQTHTRSSVVGFLCVAAADRSRNEISRIYEYVQSEKWEFARSGLVAKPPLF